MHHGNYDFVALDIEGKVWTWGKGNLLGDGTSNRMQPVCISNIAGNPLCDNNVKIKKVSFDDTTYSGRRVWALDEQGKIWFWGESLLYSLETWPTQTTVPVCISDTTEELNNIIFKDMFCGYQQIFAIDNEGKAWAWGNNYKCACGVPETVDDRGNLNNYIRPICISNIEGSNIQNVKIKKAVAGYGISLLIDTENKLWAIGSSDYGKIGNGIEVEYNGSNNPYYWNPICLNDNNPNNPLNGIGIIDVACQYETISAIDEDGKLWTWGKEEDSGQLGTGSAYTYDGSGDYNKKYAIYPICITDMENNELDTAKLVSTSAPYYNNAVAIDIDGNLWIWGDDSLPLGLGNVSTPIPPTKLTMSKKAYFDIPKFVKISAGYTHSVGIDEEGKVWTWGENEQLQLGIGYEDYSNRTSTNIPVCVGGYNNKISNVKIVDISAGNGYTLALDSYGNLWTWGYNSCGCFGVTDEQLVGDSNIHGDPICISTFDIPENILYGKKIEKISAKYQHSAVIDNEGKLYTFGENRVGQLGNGFDTYMSSNTEYNKAMCLNDINTNLNNVKFVEVSTGTTHTIALDNQGRIWTFGGNEYGQLGFDYEIGDSSSRANTPTCISEITSNNLYGIKIKQVSAGDGHSIAIDEEGNVWTWGKNYSKQLGDGTETSTYMPICLSNITGNKLYGKRITKVYAGRDMSMMIDEEGKIWTCGSNTSGQLGQKIEDTYQEADIECINNDVRLVAKEACLGNNFCLVLDNNRKIWSWGASNSGASGFTSDYKNVPVKLQGSTEKLNPLYGKQLNKISDVTAETVTGNLYNSQANNSNNVNNINNIKKQKIVTNATMILDEDGNLYTYGTNNSYGILGDGTTESRMQAKVINDKFDGKAIEDIVYLSNTLAVVKDREGYIWTWGQNNYGQLGIGSTNIESRSYPSKIEFKVKHVYVSGNTVTAVDENDILYMWGQNNYGQCSGEDSNVASPTRVGSFDVKEVLKYGNTMIVLDKEDKIWTWGQNNYGQCGTGETGNIKTPKCINDAEGNALTVDKVISKGATNIIQDTQEKIWAWGQNNYGQCGTGNKTSVLTPTQINSSNGLIIESTLNSATSTNTHIVKDTQGKVWTWGYNGYGMCGTGNNTNVLVPTCISTGTELEEINIARCITLTTNIIVVEDTEGKMWTWGKNNYGQCGTGTTSAYCQPKCLNSISELENVTFSTVREDSNSIIAVDTQGKTWVWGYNYYGKLGVAKSETIVRTPVCRDDYFKQIGLELGNKAIIKNSKYFTYYAIDINGDIWTWGQNNFGQCGTGTTENVLEPTCITREKQIKVDKFISTGIYVIIKDKDGKVWTWGRNNYGQCGTGSEGDVLSPTCISNNNTFIIEENDKYYGRNEAPPAAPRPPAGSTVTVNVSPSYKYNYVLKENGDVWVWGNGIQEPTKLNSLEEINNMKVKEVAINTSNEKIDILTEDGKLYRVSNTLEVEDVNGAETIGYYLESGPWKYEFKVVKNAKYTM